MARDECRDCGRPAGEGAEERDGRCQRCHEEFEARQPAEGQEEPAGGSESTPPAPAGEPATAEGEPESAGGDEGP